VGHVDRPFTAVPELLHRPAGSDNATRRGDLLLRLAGDEVEAAGPRLGSVGNKLSASSGRIRMHFTFRPMKPNSGEFCLSVGRPAGTVYFDLADQHA
jgi:hypothetical protein